MPKGRPALSDVAKLGTLGLRVTASERARLDAAATITGKPTSTWGRDTLLEIADSIIASAAKKPARKRQ